ncbi:hypothetical protein [Poriferisphaera sp. WC338]|uniref:hypothetical protein n=1 Tax=Poriferisphaera sp. WC338 TaxID=3425129 RepID=UPI003D812975
MKHLHRLILSILLLTFTGQAQTQTTSDIFIPEKRIYPYAPHAQDTTEFYLRPYRSWVRNGFPFYASRDVKYPNPSIMLRQNYWKKGQKESGSILLGSKSRAKPGPLSEASKLNRYPGTKNSYYAYPKGDVYEYIENVRRHRSQNTAEKMLCKLDLGPSGHNALGGWAELDPLNHTGFYYMPRTKQGHLLQYESFLDIYARYSDYEQCTEFNSFGALNQPNIGYAISTQWQEEGGRRHHIMNFSMLRSVKYEAPFKWVIDTNPRVVPSAKSKEKEIEILKEILYKGKKASFRQRNRVYVRGSDHDSHAPLDVWTRWALAYISNADIFTSQYGMGIQEGKPLYRDITKNLFVKYPNPGGHYSPIAYMHDIYTGWQTVRDTYWRKVEPSEGDWAYELLFSALYPKMHPHSAANALRPDQLQSISHTPFGGDLVNTITTKTADDLLARYSMIVFSTELNAHGQTLGDKFIRYATNGGNAIITAANAKKMWPEWNLTQSNKTVVGKISFNNQTINEPLPFKPWTATNLPPHNVIAYQNKTPLLVEIPIGKGCITLSLSSFGLASFRDAPAKPYFSTLKHYEALIQLKAKSLQLFDLGEAEDNFMVSASRAKDGIYTVLVANNNHNQQSCSLDSPFGITDHIEVNVGNPQPIIKTNLAYEVPATFKYKKPPTPKKYKLLGFQVSSKSEADKVIKNIKQANIQFEKQARAKFDQYMNTITPGRTTDSTIVGGGIRVFRTRLQDEKNINILPHYIAPKRRPRWYAAMSPWNIRQRLYLMPNFWEYFSGIKITAQDFLDWNEDNISFEYAWLTVRHVEFIIDATTIQSPETRKQIINKMSRLAYAKHLIVNEPDSATISLARRHKINLLSTDDVLLLDANTFPSDSLHDNLNNSDTLKIVNSINLDSTYQDWDTLYADYRQWIAYAKDSSRSPNIINSTPARPTLSSKQVNLNKKSRHLIHLGVSFHDIPALLTNNPDILKQNFRGFVCNTFYAFSRTSERLKQENEYLKSLGLELMIDLSNNINGGGSLFTFSPFPHFGLGDDAFFSTIENIGKAGIKNIIINAPFSKPIDYKKLAAYRGPYKIQNLSNTQRDKILKTAKLTFEERAFKERMEAMNQYGITAHLRSNLNNFRNPTAKSPFFELHHINLSANPTTPKTKKTKKKTNASNLPKSSLYLVSQGDHEPIHSLNKTILENNLPTDSKAMVILDAEYFTADEISRDLTYFNAVRR